MGKRIFLTVDTECHDYKKLNQYITGNTPKGNFGLEKILELGRDLGVPVNVFLDIPECHPYGDEHIRKIVSLADKYGHSICLHVHPDYIADPKRKHLWEYTKEEQKDILRTAIRDYKKFCGNHDRIFFRAGAWGVNKDTYEVLAELQTEIGKLEIVDLSYVYHSRRRCHLSYEEYGAVNACKEFEGVKVFPNTSYIGFDYFGKQLPLGITVPGTCFGEFKKIVNQNRLNNLTYTMHSWDFTKRWFFIPNKLWGDKGNIRKFKKCVEYAKQKGYVFDDLQNMTLSEEDQCINLCKGIIGKISCLWYNYRRFAAVGRTYKKYAILYFSPVILLVFILALLFILMLFGLL